MHIKPRPVPHCNVLTPGELNCVIPELLPVRSEGFTTTAAVTVLPYNVANRQKGRKL